MRFELEASEQDEQRGERDQGEQRAVEQRIADGIQDLLVPGR
jgi:hypothetical protein